MVFPRQRKTKQALPKPDPPTPLLEFQTPNFVKELEGTPQPCGICSSPIDFTQPHTYRTVASTILERVHYYHYPSCFTCTSCGALFVSQNRSTEGSSAVSTGRAPGAVIYTDRAHDKGIVLLGLATARFECYACWEGVFHLFGDSNTVEKDREEAAAENEKSKEGKGYCYGVKGRLCCWCFWEVDKCPGAWKKEEV